MEKSRLNKIRLLLLFSFCGIATGFLLCGCPSAIIMASGLTEGSIFGSQLYPKTKANILKKLGPPVQTLQFSSPIHADEICWYTGGGRDSLEWNKTHRRQILIMDSVEKGSAGQEHTVHPNPEITHMEKYTKVGRITPNGYAGDNMAVSSALPVVGEAVLIPATIVYKTRGKNTQNTFWVWYDANDTPVAYEWEFLSPEDQDSTPTPPPATSK